MIKERHEILIRLKKKKTNRAGFGSRNMSYT